MVGLKKIHRNKFDKAKPNDKIKLSIIEKIAILISLIGIPWTIYLTIKTLEVIN